MRPDGRAAGYIRGETILNLAAALED
jgi:hypothetical protein